MRFHFRTISCGSNETTATTSCVSRWCRLFFSYVPVHREDTMMRCNTIDLWVPCGSCHSVYRIFHLLLCLVWHNKNPKKRGKSWKYSPLPLCGDLWKTPLLARFPCQAQILTLEILNVCLWLKFSPSLNSNENEHFSKVSCEEKTGRK